MRLTLRARILLMLVPLLALLAIVGGAGVVLLYRLGGSIDRLSGSIDLILRENYASVIAMENLNEALERIDSSFQFALAGKGEKARVQYDRNWHSYREALRVEQNNITLPGEKELVDELERLTKHYRQQGDDFYARPIDSPGLNQLYFDEAHQAGLLQTFSDIKRVSGKILQMNQDNIEKASKKSREASKKSRELAATSLVGLGIGLALAVVLALALALQTIRTILHAIKAVTQSALAIGQGNLDQVVPVTSHDELGQLAHAFNTMGRQLRHYRQTDYAKLLRAQRTSQATIDSFPDPVLVVDSEGRVEMANPAARQLLGVTPRTTEQEARLPWQPPESLRQPLAEALQKQQNYLPEGFDRAVPLSSDGKESLYLPRMLVIRDPYENLLGAAVLFQDVTRFQLLDQVKSNLVATVSHELKTPLTSIRLAVHLLLEEAAGPLTPKQTELLVDSRDNAERLLATINNLLDLTRLERGKGYIELRPASPAEILQTAAEAIRPRAEGRGLTLAVDVPTDLPLVGVDRQRFGHALLNLLDNAMNYTERGGHITLSAESAGPTVTLSVADTCMGIPPQYLPHAFERLFRVPGSSQDGGTGLGLAIVQEIVTAHGGSIRCTSTPGQGTVFRITLPIWTGESAPEARRGGDTR